MKENDNGLYEEIKTTEIKLPEFVSDEQQSDVVNTFAAQQSDVVNTFATRQSYEPLEGAETIKNRSYLVDGKKKEGSFKDSKEMKAVLTELEGISAFFDTMEFSYEDEGTFLTMSEALLDRLKHLVEKCDNYLEVKSPKTTEGKVRYRMITRIAERADKDIIGLSEKAKAFLTLPAEEKSRIKSWADLLNWERTLVFKEGEDTKITHTGGNTSDVLVIEKGGQKQYFKEESKLKDANLRFIIDDKQDEIVGAKESNVEKDTPEYYSLVLLGAMRKELCDDPAMVHATVNAFFKFTTSPDGFEDLKKTSKIMSLSKFGEVNNVINAIEGIQDQKKKEEVKKAVGSVFTEVRRSMIMADVGTKSARISAGEGMAKRNVATSRLAKLLGLEKLVPDCEMASIEAEGKKKYGVVMDEAEGMEAMNIYAGKVDQKYREKNIIYSSDTVRELFNMQIFDALCGQADRHEGNVLLRLKENKYKGKPYYLIDKATGIDLDNSFGKINYSDLMSGKHSGLKIEDKKGRLLIPGMSKELAESILALSPDMLNYEMMGLLSKKERQALIDRLTGIQEAIKRQKEYEAKHLDIPSKFIGKDEWRGFRDSIRQKAQKDADYRKWLKKNTYVRPVALMGMRVPKDYVSELD